MSLPCCRQLSSFSSLESGQSTTPSHHDPVLTQTPDLQRKPKCSEHAATANHHRSCYSISFRNIVRRTNSSGSSLLQGENSHKVHFIYCYITWGDRSRGSRGFTRLKSCRMQSAKKPAKLEELTFLKVRLWLVWSILGMEIFGNFRTLDNFPVSGRGFPVALI